MHPLSRNLLKARKGQVFTAKGIEYELLGMIGNGAAGVVRKARVRSTGQVRAVKFLAPDPKYIDPNAFDDVAQRFRREGIRGAELDHENLVKIIAYEDNAEGACFGHGAVTNPFLVMEYTRGCTLESILLRTSSDPFYCGILLDHRTLSIAVKVCRSLDYLHGLKIVHRDVKPANIFLSKTAPDKVPSVVKLGDFGVTKWGDFRAAYATGTLTVSHQQGLGTLKYMSPEQAVRPKKVTVRSDMFSLGITLFELFTGHVLPSPHHVFEIMTARKARGAVVGKLREIGVVCSFGYEARLFELILDMFLQGPKGRPTSARTLGELVNILDAVEEADGSS